MNQRQHTPDNQMTFLQFSVDAVKKRPYALFLTSLLIAITGIVVISLIPNQYKATTTILVDPQKIPERYVASTITSDPNAHLNTLMQQVLSASSLEEIVDQLNLYPEIRKTKSHEELLDFIRNKIKIELKPGTEQGLSSFSISYVDANRSVVAPVANQLAENFIDTNLKSRQQQAIVTTQFLSNELVQAHNSLEEQEAALQAFRMQHVGATPDQLDGNLQALSRLQADVQSNIDALSRLDEERILLSQSKTAATRDPSSLTERERLTLERNRLDNELATLHRQYTDTYPDVVAAQGQLDTVNARLAKLPQATAQSEESYDSSTRLRIDFINKEIERHKAQIATLRSHIGAYQGKVQSVPVLETQLAELTRNYETSRQNYQSLLDKKLSAGMSEDLERKQQAERFTVLDLARTPEKPFQPKRLPFMAGAVVAAILIAAAAIILIAQLRGAIRSQSDLVASLPSKIPVLGTIPPIASETDRWRQRVTALQVAAVSALACIALAVFLIKVRPIL
jgi:succinoglycan biosynthesis transport protein ExoP